MKAIDAASAESSYTNATSSGVAFTVDTVSRYLSFQSNTGSGLESVTATSIKIVLSQAHFEPVTVNYAVISASTTAEGSGADYTLTSGTATISIGQTSTTFSLSIVDDQIDEPDETIGILLSSPSYAIIGSNTSTLYSVTDNVFAGVTITDPGGSTTQPKEVTDTFTVVLPSQPVQSKLPSRPQPGLTLSTSTSVSRVAIGRVHKR